MTEKTYANTEDRLYADDVVNYIALRHRISPQELIRHFTALEKESRTTDVTSSVRLEQNEIEMLRDLCATIYKEL